MSRSLPPLWLVDAGNTTLKLQHVDGADIAAPLVIARKSLEEDPGLATQQLLQAASRFAPATDAFACCARSADFELVKALLTQLAPRSRPQFLSAASKLPFAIRYESGMPGPDRLAAAFALRSMSPGAAAASVDFGTATNIVVVNAEGDFAGGSIMPGLGLAASSLHDATNGVLPEVRFPKDDPLPPALGNSPEAAIRSGVLFGQAGAVERLLAEMEAQIGATFAHRIVTGGNASRVIPLLRGKFSHEPHLTLAGLLAWAQDFH